jgi:hypothetical protein
MPHATWSPSGATYWYNWGRGCPARTLPPRTPETSSPAAEEGTRLHEVAEKVLKRGNWRGVAKEDKALLEVYVNYVRARAESSPIAELEIEAACELLPITGEDAAGTADALILQPAHVDIEVVDLKTGAVRVTPENNLQLMIYLATLVFEMELTGSDMCRGTIVQGGEIRSCDWTARELRDMAEGVWVWCEEFRDEKPEVPSDHNCTWCPHITTCKAVVDYANKRAAEEFAVPQGDEELAEALTMVGPLRKYAAAVEGKALEKMKSGVRVPGYKLVAARTNRRWSKEAEQELVDLLGEDAYDHKLIGLTAGDKLLDAETMERLTIKPEGKPTIAPEDDPRPTLNDAKEDFANV